MWAFYWTQKNAKSCGKYAPRSGLFKSLRPDLTTNFPQVFHLILQFEICNSKISTHHPFFCSVLGRRSRVVTLAMAAQIHLADNKQPWRNPFFVFPQKNGTDLFSVCARTRIANQVMNPRAGSPTRALFMFFLVFPRAWTISSPCRSAGAYV